MAILKNKKTEEKKPKVAEEKEAVSMKDLYGSKGSSAKAGKGSTATRKNGFAYRILIKPLVTEKASVLGAENKYVFNVAYSSNKIEVAKAIEEVYGIKPTAVNIVKVMGKKTRQGKTQGKRKDWKKAIITLPAGQSIKVYEGV